MKLFKLSLGLATLALGIASAASSYKVNIPADTWAGDTQIKAGDRLQDRQAAVIDQVDTGVG